MATGYDSTDPSGIPVAVAPPDYALGYVDGHWQSYLAMHARFPNAVPVSITAIPGSERSGVAMVCDCEDGDYTPNQAADWAKARIAHGAVPCVYCSLSAWPLVQGACAGLTIDWWIAAYPGNGPALYPGSIGHQWIDRGTYDESVFENGWIPGRPIGGPPPQIRENEMIASTPSGNGYWICKSDGSIWSKGDATYLGGSNPGASAPMPAGHVAVGFAAHPTSQGYWIETDHGEVYAFGGAAYHGGAP